MTIRELLACYRGLRVHVLPNPGHGGDGLIQMGLRRLCAEMSLEVCELYYPQPASGELLLAPGNGNLCEPYHSVPERVRRYAESFRSICILPCSVDTASPVVRDFLSGLPQHAHLFCRERYSYEQARGLIGAGRNVWLDHDLAFEADLSAWRRPARGTLYSFRSDAESAGVPSPSGNFDISSLTGEWMHDVFLDVVSSFAVVHTDRAHVAITAALLGRETHVYATAYHKLRGIYEFSLAERPNVTFHAERGFMPALGTTPDVRFAKWRERAAAMFSVRAAEGFG